MKRARLKQFLKGFTLVESLVVVTIILVLTLVVVPNYRAGEKLLLLDQAAAKLNQDVRRMEEQALSAKEFRGLIPRGGYGIYVVTGNDFYTLFADCDQNYQYTISGSPCNGPEKIEDVSLGQHIQVASLSSSPLTVVFSPPHPVVRINGDTLADEATMALSLKTDLTKTRNIRINKAGLIETY